MQILYKNKTTMKKWTELLNKCYHHLNQHKIIRIRRININTIFKKNKFKFVNQEPPLEKHSKVIFIHFYIWTKFTLFQFYTNNYVSYKLFHSWAQACLAGGRKYFIVENMWITIPLFLLSMHNWWYLKQDVPISKWNLKLYIWWSKVLISKLAKVVCEGFFEHSLFPSLNMF